MPLQEFFHDLSGARRVYGEPYEKDGVTVIPAVSIRVAGGFGSGSGLRGRAFGDERAGATPGEGGGGGGGGTAHARPVGAYVIKEGKVTWLPAVDVNRIVLGGQILCGLALVVLALRSRVPGRRDR